MSSNRPDSPELTKAIESIKNAGLTVETVQTVYATGKKYTHRKTLLVEGKKCFISLPSKLQRAGTRKKGRLYVRNGRSPVESTLTDHEFMIFFIDLRKRGLNIEKIFVVPMSDFINAGYSGAVSIPVEPSFHMSSSTSGFLDWTRYEGALGLALLK